MPDEPRPSDRRRPRPAALEGAPDLDGFTVGDLRRLAADLDAEGSAALAAYVRAEAADLALQRRDGPASG